MCFFSFSNDFYSVAVNNFYIAPCQIDLSWPKGKILLRYKERMSLMLMSGKKDATVIHATISKLNI